MVQIIRLSGTILNCYNKKIVPDKRMICTIHLIRHYNYLL